jgi:hypothetical protein
VVDDYLPDSPVVSRSYCPGCEPEADPSKEVLDVRWCERHAPDRDGRDDDAVRSQQYLSGSAEAGGEENKRWCDFVHRDTIHKDKKEEPNEDA